MANYDLATILDECISRVQAGEPVSACVQDYPEYAEQLWPLLTAAADLSTLPRPLVEAQGRSRGRERMLAQLAQSPTQPVSFLASLRYAAQKITGSLAKERPNMKLVLRSALTAVCLLILSTAIVTASQNSLPGDPLYPVKRSWEWVQGSFTTVSEQASYEDLLLERRYQELQLLMEMGRQVSFDLEGLLTAQTATTLQVAGFTIQTNADTQWLSLPIVGEMVQVSLTVHSNGTLVARQITSSDRPVPAMTATPTATVTRTPNSCTGGACPTATPTACTTPNCVTPTPTPCNTPNCITPTPTPCTTSPACVTVTATPTATRTPNCNPANCHTPTPTPWCGATICPTFTPTATPSCNTGICPTKTPVPTITRTPNCTPSTCATATPVPTATPTTCNTPNCTPPTTTPTPGCNPANCPTATATPTPGCSAGACPTPTPTACNTPNCTPATATPIPPTATSTPGCTPSTCPTATPTATPGCNTGSCATPPPTPTQCNTPNCVTPTFTPPPGCSPTNCPTPTPTPWCGATVCPTFTPTIQGQNKGLHSLHIRFR